MTTNHLCVDLYQGDEVTSFADAYAAGVRLIILKATEGMTVQDHTFAPRLAAARAAGMMVGAYHFLRATPIDNQIANFLSVAKPADDMRWVMDWETADATPDMAREFLEKLDADTGKKTIVYSYNSFLHEHLGAAVDPVFAAHPLWIAAYSQTPPKLQASWQKYLLWQNSETSRIPGVPGTATGVDSSHFDGTETELRAAWMETSEAPFALPPSAEAVFDLKAAQTKLIGLGFDLGPSGADGVDGQKTTAALKAYAMAALAKI